MFKQVESLKRWDGTQWVDVLFVEPVVIDIGDLQLSDEISLISFSDSVSIINPNRVIKAIGDNVSLISFTDSVSVSIN